MKRLNRKQKRLMFMALMKYEYEVKTGLPWEPPIDHREQKWVKIKIVTPVVKVIVTESKPQETKAAKRTRNVEERARRLAGMATHVRA